MNETPLNATVTWREDLTSSLAVVHVRPDAGKIPAFEAGQFCTLGLPEINGGISSGGGGTGKSAKHKQRLIRRAYSIASSANERDFVEIYVALVEEGKLTPNLWTVEEGGRVFMGDKIVGDFVLNGETRDKNIVMVATGTGIAPFASMLRTYHGQDRWRRLVVIHGVRLVEDLGYRDMFTRAARRDPRVTYLPTVTREPDDSDWQGLRGRVQPLLDEKVFRSLVGFDLSPEDTHVYLCGNPAMIESVSEDLQGRGFTSHSRKQPGNLHFERYW